MLLSIYIISALLCLAMLAAIAINNNGAHGHDRFYLVLAAIICVLTPALNTLIAVLWIVSCAYVLIKGYK